MRAVICSTLGGPAALTFGEMPRPELGPKQVRIAVKAAGLNFADTLIVQGKYQVKPALPFVPGLEAAGTITEVGAEVRGAKIGDRVMAALGVGAFAEEVVCNAGCFYPMPAGMDFVAAASFPIVYGTAQAALARRAHLQSGETLLVLGAAGGVGIAAIECGKALGATVIAAARGADKLAIARDHGADHVIDYANEDVRERIKAITNGRGIDVIFDPIGGDTSDAAFRSLRWEGRIVIVGFAAGKIQQIPANLLLVKNISAVGLFWGEYRNRDPELVREWFDELSRWYEQGKIKPHVSHVLPAEKAPEAMDLLLQRKSTGKIVLTF
jgi:NADPH2:quinone reductase